MTTPEQPDAGTPDSEMADTGGHLDAAHDDTGAGGPHLATAAEERSTEGDAQLADDRVS